MQKSYKREGNANQSPLSRLRAVHGEFAASSSSLILYDDTYMYVCYYGLGTEISVIQESRMTMCGFRSLSFSIRRVVWTVEIQLG
jgi:hypothetical protein